MSGIYESQINFPNGNLYHQSTFVVFIMDIQKYFYDLNLFYRSLKSCSSTTGAYHTFFEKVFEMSSDS